jgi:hypothetical protein
VPDPPFESRPLAILGVMFSSATLGAHQSILTTEGWTDAMGEITSDPAVIEAAGVVVVDRVSEALELRSIVVDMLPDQIHYR